MFNATNGAAASQARIEKASDQLAADAIAFLDNPGIARAVKEEALKAAASIFASPEALTSLAAGEFTQNSAGQPALQLGSANAPTPAELAKSIKDFVAANNGLRPEQADLAMRALLPPGDRGHIKAEAGGEPAGIADLRDELKNTKDPKIIGSLAFELAQEKKEAAAEKKRLTDELTAERNKPGPSGWVKAEGLDDLIDQVIEQVQNIGRGGGHAYAKSEALKKLDQLKGKVTV